MSRDRIVKQRVAVYLLLVDDDRVLMLRRYGTSYEDGQYSLIAGHVEPDESITEAATREASEETGIRVHSRDLQFVHVMYRRGVDDLLYADFYLLARTWEGTAQNQEPTKCDEVCWFPLSALPLNTIRHVREAIAHVFVHRQPFSEYGWADIRAPFATGP